MSGLQWIINSLKGSQSKEINHRKTYYLQHAEPNNSKRSHKKYKYNRKKCTGEVACLYHWLK